MGKALSELQRKILRMAYRNRLQDARMIEADISARQVLVEYYGFPTIKNIETAENGAIVFSRKAIGGKRYQSASVCVARAFDRLTARGLAHRKYCYGITLTEKGIKLAEALGQSASI